MATRTDQHRPAEFSPEDYECVGYFYNKTQPFFYRGPNANGEYLQVPNPAYKHFEAMLALIEASTTTPYHTGYQCDHCGARIAYVAVFLHKPTGDHLAVGEICADGRFEMDKAEFHRLRKGAELDRAEQKILKAWREYTAENAIDWDKMYASTNSFVQDVLRRGRQYGSLTEKQLSAIVNAVSRDETEAALTAALPEVVSIPVIEGRYEIAGQVLTTKFQEGYYGTTYKMLVLVTTDDGQYKLWGTVPAAIDGVRKGDTISFTATVSKSDRDESFGFFSRPAKAQLIAEAI